MQYPSWVCDFIDYKFLGTFFLVSFSTGDPRIFDCIHYTAAGTDEKKKLLF